MPVFDVILFPSEKYLDLNLHSILQKRNNKKTHFKHFLPVVQVIQTKRKINHLKAINYLKIFLRIIMNENSKSSLEKKENIPTKFKIKI